MTRKERWSRKDRHIEKAANVGMKILGTFLRQQTANSTATWVDECEWQEKKGGQGKTTYELLERKYVMWESAVLV